VFGVRQQPNRGVVEYQLVRHRIGDDVATPGRIPT
jgi:hypothetical protein